MGAYYQWSTLITDRAGAYGLRRVAFPLLHATLIEKRTSFRLHERTNASCCFVGNSLTVELHRLLVEVDHVQKSLSCEPIEDDVLWRRCPASVRYSLLVSIPMPRLPRFRAATKDDPVPTKGSSKMPFSGHVAFMGVSQSSIGKGA